MNIFNKVVISEAEHILKPHRKKAEVFKNDNFTEYQKYLPLINEKYKELFYWHGTGRFHYHHANESRYEEKDQNQYVDIIESILGNGLTPHFDPFIKVNGQYIKTISLTKYRMHARLYSGVHRYKDNFSLYEFGTTKYWLYLFVILVTIEIIKHPTKNARDFVKNVFNKRGRSSLRQWPEAIKKTEGMSDLSLLKAYKWHSDIIGNYPILFGIKKDEIKGLQIGQFLDSLETRTPQTISIENFTHMEVPLDRVREMEKLLQSKNIKLIVIPMEFGEVYSSQFSVQKLIYS
ncbi:MAG: hypothetical protein WAN61_01245 [Minisyncoccia bacterium]